jgi:hypothetical protein
MATARARAVRHLIGCMRTCLRGEAAGALLATVEQHVARLLSDGDDWDEYDDWPDPDERKRAVAEDASPAARAARRAAAFASLDRAWAALGAAEEDGDVRDDPERASARLAAAEFSLDATDEAVLLLALRCAAPPTPP